MNLWTFFVELKETADIISSSSYPNLIYSKGDVPEEAPEKIFETDNEKEFEGNDEDGDIDLDYNDSEFY